MKSLENIIVEMEKYGSSDQRVFIDIDDFDHYYDTTVGGARVAVAEDMSSLTVKRIEDKTPGVRWIPVLIYCKTQS